MRYLFEVLSEQGKILRSGIVNKGQKIKHGEEDHYIIFKEEAFPHRVIQSGYVSRKKEKRIEKIAQFSFETKEHIEVRLFEANVQYRLNGNDVPIRIDETIRIPKRQGIHEFYTNNNSYSFRVGNETINEQLDKISFSQEEKEIAELIYSFSREYGYNTHEAILKYINRNKEESEEKIEHWIALLGRYELFINTRHKINTKTNWLINRQQRIVTNAEIDNIKIYLLDGEKKDLIRKQKVQEGDNISLPVLKPVLIEGYIGDSFISSRICSQLSNDMRKVIWEQERKKAENSIRVLEMKKLIREDESEYQEIINTNDVTPHFNSFVRKPYIFEKETNWAKIEIEDYYLLRQFDRQFYLVISTIEDYGIYHHKKEITSNEIEIDEYSEAIHLNQDLFLWIEDENGVAVSDKEIHIGSDEMGSSTVREFYNEKNVESIYKIAKEIDSIGYAPIVMNILRDSSIREGSSYESLVSDIVSSFIQKGLWKSGWLVLKEILESRDKFYSEPSEQYASIIYVPQNHSFVIDTEYQNFVAVVEEFEKSTGKKEVRYLTKTRELFLRKDYAIIRLYNFDSYKHTGFASISKNAIFGTNTLTIKAVN